MSTYPQSQGGQTVYASQSAHSYIQQPPQPSVAAFQTGAGAAGKYPASQSAFTSYSGHYAGHQASKAEGFPASYGLQRMQQPGQWVECVESGVCCKPGQGRE